MKWGNVMSTVSFAKFNINEKIYEVYDGKESLGKLLNILYQSMTTEVEMSEEDRKKVVNFKFITLDKNPDTMVINGRLVAYAPGTHISYDSEKDDVVETADNKKATYVTFSFDIQKEIIGFVTKVDFGWKQFLRRFKTLIEASAPELGEVELILESDNQILKEKLGKFKHVQEVTINLVPPNNDKKLFEKLFDLDPDKLNKTGGTKFLLNIKGSAKHGIDLTSSYLRNIINGISIGYGNLTAIGKNTSDEVLRVKSEKDAVYTKPIADINKDSIPEVAEKTRAGIIGLAAIKAEIKEEYDEDLKDTLIKELVGDDSNGESKND